MRNQEKHRSVMCRWEKIVGDGGFSARRKDYPIYKWWAQGFGCTSVFEHPPLHFAGPSRLPARRSIETGRSPDLRLPNHLSRRVAERDMMLNWGWHIVDVLLGFILRRTHRNPFNRVRMINNSTLRLTSWRTCCNGCVTTVCRAANSTTLYTQNFIQN
jgi:hypothetical protein